MPDLYRCQHNGNIYSRSSKPGKVVLEVCPILLPVGHISSEEWAPREQVDLVQTAQPKLSVDEPHVNLLVYVCDIEDLTDQNPPGRPVDPLGEQVLLSGNVEVALGTDQGRIREQEAERPRLKSSSTVQRVCYPANVCVCVSMYVL